MKKQFILIALMIFTGVCFTAVNRNNVKACVSNVSACSTVTKKTVKKAPVDFVEDLDVSFDMFMNPFTQL